MAKPSAGTRGRTIGPQSTSGAKYKQREEQGKNFGKLQAKNGGKSHGPLFAPPK
jgi:hypothetical protein